MWHRLLPQYFPSNNGGREKYNESSPQNTQPHLPQRLHKARRRPWRRQKPALHHRKDHNVVTMTRLLSLDMVLDYDYETNNDYNYNYEHDYATISHNNSEEMLCWTENENDDDEEEHEKVSTHESTMLESTKHRRSKIEKALMLFDNSMEQFSQDSSLKDEEESNSPSYLDGSVMTMPSLVDNSVATETTINTMPSLLDNTVTTIGDDEENNDDHDHDEDADMTVSTVADEDDIEKAVNAVLKDHHNNNQNRDVIFLSRRRESSLLVASRDSCSTISTAPDTPESSLVISEYLVCVTAPTRQEDDDISPRITNTTTTTKNPSTAPCHCPMPACPRCSQTVWPLEFFFVHTDSQFPSNLPGIRKSKKFVPDPMTVGDFYGDDDEDIRFVPQTYQEEIVFSDAQHDHTDDEEDDHDATTTITTWRGDYDEDEDDVESDILSDGSGSDIISYLTGVDAIATPTATPTPLGVPLATAAAAQDRSHSDSDITCFLTTQLEMDEWSDPESDDMEVYSKRTSSKKSIQNSLWDNMVDCKIINRRIVRATVKQTPVAAQARKEPTLCRYPSVGLDVVLPPSRHNTSMMFPTVKTGRGSFQVTRLEI